MKKIFFFIAAMVVVMTANAAIINGTPNGEERGRVNWWVNGEGQAQAGDTIVLADGVYYESTLTIEKDVVIMAAEGAKPEINIARVYGCVKLAGPASVTFDGITFNGNDSVKYMIAVTGADVKKLTVNNCEFKNWTYWAISNQFEKGASIDSVIVENSVFHDGLGSAVHFSEDAPVGKHACNYLKVANSTLYNITSTEYAAIIQANSNGQAEGEQNEIIIDHITLYNFDASQLGAIAMRKSSKLTISNSIIATPENKDHYAFYIYGGNVNNTLYFNGKAKSGPTYTDCLTDDPKFVDAANGNFALADGSPALTAGTDGKAIGDPRWNVVAEPEPGFYNVTVTGATASVNGQNIDINAQWNEQSMLIRLWQGGATQGFGTYAAEDYGPIMLGGGMKEWTPTTEGVYADNGDGTFTFTCSATDGTTQYNITVTGNNPTQGGGEGDVEEPEYPVMEDAITNLVLDLNTMTCKGGPSSSFSIIVELYIGEPNVEGTLFNLTQESTISVMGNPATFVSGYIKDINTSAPSLTAVVVAQLNEYETYQFEIAMSAEEIEAMPIEVTNANITVEEYKPFPEAMPEYSLNMKATWTDAEGITYPVTVKVYTYDPNATEATESLCDVKIGDIINDPWLGGVDGCYLTITTENGVVTATGTISNLNTGFAADFTISGSLAQGPSTGVENLNGTVAPVKVIENGQIFIIRNGVKYNAQGAQL